MCSARRSAALRVGPEEADARTLDSLELVERPREAALALLALEDLVGDELDDERPPRERRTGRGAADHARRVHDVGATGRRCRTSRTQRA